MNQSVRRQQKKKLFQLKFKIVLTIILPLLVFTLGIHVIRMYIRLKMRRIFAKPFPKDKDS